MGGSYEADCVRFPSVDPFRSERESALMIKVMTTARLPAEMRVVVARFEEDGTGRGMERGTKE